MKVRSEETELGTFVHFLEPESEADVLIIDKLIEMGKCSINQSFGDWKNAEAPTS